MDVIAPLIGLTGIATLIAGIAARFIPKHRSKWLKLVLGGFAALVIGIAMTPPPTPEQLAEQAAVETKKAEVKKANEAAASAQVTEGKRAKVATFTRFYQEMLSKVGPCDAANNRAVDAVQAIQKGTGDNFAAYAAADAAKTACNNAFLEVGRLAVPDALEAQQADLEKAVKQCELAMFGRKQALEAMMAVLDGDARPSQVQAFTKQSEAAQADAYLCAGLFVGSATKAGLSEAEIKAL